MKDVLFLFNCKISMHHLNYNVYDWTNNSNQFTVVDPFIIQHQDTRKLKNW